MLWAMTGGRPSQHGAPAALLLAPGAGAGSHHGGLVAIDDALTAAGTLVRRVDFPYVLAGRRVPDRPPVLLATITQAASALAAEASVPAGSVVLGGRSMGGRICSMAVAAGLPAAALVLVSYPLHPPGHSDRLRTEHFPTIGVPCLFVSGTRDAFGTPDELERATSAIPGPVTHVWIDGGDHGLRRHAGTAAAAVRAWLVTGP